MTAQSYVLGSAPEELERLIWQDQNFLRPITERLLTRAGIKEGMRILDLGCGVGSVSLLAAEMVGSSGAVVGIDQSAQAIAMAEQRARESSFKHVEFQVSEVGEFFCAEQFDMTIGRLVLIFQPDPAAFIRAARRLTRTGGVVAFHEICLHRGYHALPSFPAWDALTKCLNLGFKAGAPGLDAGGRLVEHFQNAGLPCPELFAEMPVGGGEDSSIYKWLTWVARSLMPRLLQDGTITEEEIGIDTLEDRLRIGAIEVNAQVEVALNVCAWARVRAS